MVSTEFWATVRRRRNLAFLVMAGWLFVGFPLWGLFAALMPSLPPIVSGVAALALWTAVGKWAELRVTRLRCFRCGELAFMHPYFFMRHAKCMSCGVKCSDA